MYKPILLGLLSLQLIMTCFCQDSIQYKSKFQWKSMVCNNFPLKKMAKGAITDNLNSYSDNSVSWQALSFTYFFSKHWGVDANFQLGGSSTHQYSPNIDINNQSYPKINNYYISSNNNYWTQNPPLCDFNRVNLGIIYRLEKDKFVIYPKLSLGLTSFSTYSATEYLKQKNANDILQLDYVPNKSFSVTDFTVSASTTVGYRIRKRLIIFLDLTASLFRPDLSYSASITDLNTGIKSSTWNYGYKNDVSGLSLGTGIIIEMPTRNHWHKRMKRTYRYHRYPNNE